MNNESEFIKILADFSSTLREIIEEQDLTIEQLSNQLKISESTIYMWLTQQRLANIEYLIKISNHFHCSIDYLLGLSNENKHCEPIENIDFFARLQMLLDTKSIGVREFNKALGLSSRSITQWRYGVIPKTYTVVRIAMFFGCTVDFILGRE